MSAGKYKECPQPQAQKPARVKAKLELVGAAAEFFVDNMRNADEQAYADALGELLRASRDYVRTKRGA